MFIDNGMSSWRDLEMFSNGRNKAPMVVGVDESSKFLLCGLSQDIEKPKDQVGDN